MNQHKQQGEKMSWKITLGITKRYKTRLPQVEYYQVDPGCWRFLVEGRATGDYYPNRQTLVEDMKNFLEDYGFDRA